MWREVNGMASLRFSLSEGRRFELGLDSKVLSALLTRVYQRLNVGGVRVSTFVFTIAHDLMHLLLWPVWNLVASLDDEDLPSITSLFEKIFDRAVEISLSSMRERAIVFSAVLRVQFLHLIERAKESADIFRSVSPRHQDRGSGDAVSDNDNLEKERKPYIAAVAAVRATFTYRLSLITGRSSNAGRHYLGLLRRLNDPLLQ